MFPTRALLVHVDCPDFLTNSCFRPSCPFAHNHTSKRRQKQQEQEEEEEEEDVVDEEKEIRRETSSGPKRKASRDLVNESQPTGSAKRVANSELSGLLSALNAGPRNAYAAKKQQWPSLQSPQPTPPSKQVVTVKSVQDPRVTSMPSPGPSKPKVEASIPKQGTPIASSSQTIANSIQTPPSISRTSHPGSSPVPYSSRQTSLKTFFTTFYSLYSSLLPRDPTQDGTESERRAYRILEKLIHHYASQDSTLSESKIFRNSNVNFLSYRNSIRTSLVGLSRRQRVDKEAEEKGDRVCMCMLGIQVMKAACQIDEDLSLTGAKEEQRIKAVEEEITKLLQESVLIGINDEVDRKRKENEEKIKGKLDRDRLVSAELLTKVEVLEAVGYPCPDLTKGEGDLQLAINECWGEGGRERDLVGSQVACERCSVEFKVAPLGSENTDEKEACSFHWGKRLFVREKNVAKGPRLPRWTCCDQLDEATTFASNSLSQIAASAGLVESSNGQPSAPKGCTRGPHVFKEEKSDCLHKREGFLSTEQVCSNLSIEAQKKKKYDVLAFDCELVYTTAGMSLARLTVLDESGEVTLDQYVKPRAAVLDFNTRYSGIKEEDLEEGKCAVELEEARRRMAAMMTPSTVLVGHGLENDLKALRLIHLQVADSALLYKHHKGLPFRISLRDLTLKHLGKHIQAGDATHGHDPEEDARSALDLVRLKYREFTEDPTKRPSSSSTPLASTQSSSTHSEKLKSTTGSASSMPTPIPTPPPSRPSSVTSGPSEAAKASLFMKSTRPPIRRKTK